MTAAVDVVEPPPTQQVEAVVSTSDQPTPSNGVPMVAMIPPTALVEPAPTEPSPVVVGPVVVGPSVAAPTAAAMAAATVVAPAVVAATTAPVAPTPAQKTSKPQKAPKAAVAPPRRHVRARRVQRIVRRVDAWSVLKISFVFFIVLYLVLLVAGVLLWAFAVGTGTIDNVENFIQQLFALDSFSFVGAQILRASVIGGGILVIAGTFTTTVLAVLFNLISDLVGGVRFTVVEEQVLRPVQPTKPAPASGGSPSSVDAASPRPGTV